jgi:hypothetical protein
MCGGPLRTSDHRYSEAISRSWQELSDRDLRELSELSGGSINEKRILLRMLNDTLIVDFETRGISSSDGRAVDDDIQVLLLHYLMRADGKIDGTWCSYRDIEGGNLYYSVFQGRALRPLVREFGENPERLIRAGTLLGGIETRRGDASVDLQYFPYALVNVTIWKGDEEVPSSANILFDAAMSRIFGAEDLAHLSADLVEKLIAASR